MADLKLQIILSALDRITAPLKAIRGAAAPTSAALKATSDRLKELNAQQRSIDQFRVLHQGLSTTSSKMKEAQANVARLAVALKNTATPTRAMTREFDAAVKAAGRLKNEAAQQGQKLQGLRDQLSQAGISTGKLGAAQLALKADLRSSNAELVKQQNHLSDVAARQAKLSTLRSKYANIKERAGKAAMAGAAAVAVGGGTLFGAKRLIQPGIDFNEAMSRVQALSRIDKRSTDFHALRQQARDLGASTSYTATEAAQGQGYLAMAGFKPEDILKSMPGVLTMAKAGGADLARAADISSDILTSFGLKADQMNRVSDVLTMTFTTSNTNLEMLGETMKYVGPIAKEAGMSLEQASAMAGLLGNAGIKSSQAGTTLRSMLLRLASPTSAAAKALKELGVSSQDLKGNVRDIPTILRDLAKATEKMGSAKRLGYIKRVVGEEPAAGIAELINQQGTEGINKYVAMVEQSQGVAAKTATVMADNLSGDLKNLSSAWENLGITLSDSLDAPLRKMTDRLTGMLRHIDVWMKANPQLTETLLIIGVTLSTLLLVLGSVTVALSAIVVPMAALKMAFGILGIATGLALAPLLLIIAGITLVAGLAYLLYKHWAPISAWFSGFWAGLSDGLAPMGALFSRTLEVMGMALAPLKPVWDWLLDQLRECWQWLSNFISPLKETQGELDATTGSGYLLGKSFAKLILIVADLGISLIKGIVKSLAAVSAAMLDWSPLGILYQVIAPILRLFGVELPDRFSEFGSNLMASFIQGLRTQFPLLDNVMAKLDNILPGGKLAVDSPPLTDAQRQRSEKMIDSLGWQRPMTALPPMTEVGGMAKHLAQVSSGLRGSQTGMPALTFDRRPPVAAPASGPSVMLQGDTNQFIIHAAPGMDESAIARSVTAALEQQSRQKAAKLRSRLAD